MRKYFLVATLFSVYTGIGVTGVVDWEIVADKKKCSGDEIPKGKLSLEKCASECADVSLYFAHGTNDYGQNKCTEEAICDCICEGGNKCNMVMHTGYRLYRKNQIIGNINLTLETHQKYMKRLGINICVGMILKSHR